MAEGQRRLSEKSEDDMGGFEVVVASIYPKRV